MVPAYMLESKGRGQGAGFDLDQEVFVPLNQAPSDDGKSQLTVKQFAIRAADHEATVKQLLERIISGAGYSLQTFGLGDDGAAATATEVAARQKKSMTTREKKTRYWAPQLVSILQTLMQVDQAKFSGPGPFESLSIEFLASVQPTQIELATTASALKAAQAASTKTLVTMVHPDWDEKAINDEVRLILEENSFTVPPIGPLPGDRPVDDRSASSSSSA
jgi:hypothetical protein